MALRIFALMLVAGALLGQRSAEKKKAPAIRYVESGTGVVAVNPEQPYRPIPAGASKPRESIFSFYLRALNPRRIDWGTEIDRRLTILREQSVSNPYFRLAAFQLGLILFLMMLVWVWWDKMRQIKWVAAECLTDALNARSLAEQRAKEAIERHNRHMESCNRVIEGQTSGVGSGTAATDAAVTIRELQTQLAAARAESLRLKHELEGSQAYKAQMDSRLAALEAELSQRSSRPDSELIARLQRAEAELANRKPKRADT